MESTSAPSTIPTVPQPVPTAAVKPRNVGVTLVVFAVMIVALVASAVVLVVRFTAEDGHMLWVMVTMGAAIIIILLSGVFMPFLKEARHHR